MPLYKNVVSQKLAIYAHDILADTGKTGDAANITAQISKDGAACDATDDANPTELDATDAPGIYLFDLTQAETNANLVIVSPISSTGNIKIEPVIVYTSEVMRGTDGANTTVPDAAGTAPTAVEIQAEMEEDGASILDSISDLLPGSTIAAASDIPAMRGTENAATAAKLLAYIRLLARSDAAVETDAATELTAINADDGSGAGNFSSQTDSGEAIRDVAPHGSAMVGTNGANTTVPDAAGTAAGLHTTTDGKVDALPSSAAIATAVMAKVVDGTLDVTDSLKLLLGLGIAKQVDVSGSVYTFKDQAGATLITLTVGASSTTAVIA